MGRLRNFEVGERHRHELGLARAYFGASLESMCQRIADLRSVTGGSIGSLDGLLEDGEFTQDQETLLAWKSSMASLVESLEVLEKSTQTMRHIVARQGEGSIPEVG